MSCSAWLSRWSARRRRARATATSSPMWATPGSAPLRRLVPRAVRASGESASSATVAVVSSPCSKMVTRTDHSRRVPELGPGDDLLVVRGGRLGHPQHRARPGEHRARVPVLPAHDVGRPAVGAAGLEHLPRAGGLVDQLARQDDPVPGLSPSWLLLTRVVTVPRECRGGGDGHGTHLDCPPPGRPLHTPALVVALLPSARAAGLSCGPGPAVPRLPFTDPRDRRGQQACADQT